MLIRRGMVRRARWCCIGASFDGCACAGEPDAISGGKDWQVAYPSLLLLQCASPAAQPVPPSVERRPSWPVRG